MVSLPAPLPDAPPPSEPTLAWVKADRFLAGFALGAVLSSATWLLALYR